MLLFVGKSMGMGLKKNCEPNKILQKKIDKNVKRGNKHVTENKCMKRHPKV